MDQLSNMSCTLDVYKANVLKIISLGDKIGETDLVTLTQLIEILHNIHRDRGSNFEHPTYSP